MKVNLAVEGRHGLITLAVEDGKEGDVVYAAERMAHGLYRFSGKAQTVTVKDYEGMMRHRYYVTCLDEGANRGAGKFSVVNAETLKPVKRALA